MTWVAALRTRRAGRNEEGFALATTIAILLVTSMLITAMLGLTFATSTYAGDQIRRDRESRAAESGMDPAAALLARSYPPCGPLNGPICNISPNLRGVLRGQVYDKSVLGGISYDDACGWTPNTANNETEASRPPLVDTDTDDKHVEVFCTALPAERFAPETRTDSVVKLIGKVPVGDPAVTKWSSTTNTPCQPLSTPGASPLVNGGPSLNAPECLPWAEAFSAAGVTGQAAAVATSFTTAAGSRNGTALVHSGPDALQVVGDMDVSGGAAVLRNADRGASNSFVAGSPAMALSGAYRQGDPGPLPVGAPTAAGASGTSPRCGILGTNSGAAATVPSAQISAGADPVCDQPNLRTDVVTNPSLLATAPPATPWTPDRIRANDRTTAQLPAANNSTVPNWNYRYTPAVDCPVAPGGTVKFFPGAYPANITARINAWFAACSGVKFWFTPNGGTTGYYWLDVNDTVGGVPSTALRMEKTSNIWVFGTPSVDISVISKDNRPLCNSSAAGVNLTLSPRTVFRHKGGYVGICGDLTNASHQAIWQDPTANLGFQEASPTSFTGATSSNTWYDSLRNVFLVGSLINLFLPPSNTNIQNRYYSLPNGGVGMTARCSSAPCNGTAGFVTTWNPPAGQDPGRATVTSATLRITGNSIKSNDVWNGPLPQTAVALFKPNALGALPTVPTCTLNSPRINDSYGRNAAPLAIDVDLFYPGSPCGSSIDRGDLLKSRIEVIMGLNSDCSVGEIFTGCTYGVQVDSLKLVTPQTFAPPAESVPSIVSTNLPRGQVNGSANAVLAADGSTVQFQMNSYCNTSVFGLCIVYRIADSGSATIRVPNLVDRYEPSVSDANPSVDGTLTSANLRVKGYSSCDNFWFADVVLVSRIDCRDYAAANQNPSRLRVTLSRSGATVCTASFDFLPEWGQTRSYDLLNSCVSGGVKKIKYNKDLVGVDVDVAFDMYRDKSNNYGCRNAYDFPGNGCNWWRYSVDYVGLQTTVSTTANQAWDGPGSQALITSNDYAGAQREGRFNVDGAVIMPRANLRIDWIGPANQAGTPIFSGPPPTGRTTELMLASLYSYQSPAPGQNQAIASDDSQAGILCCAAAQPAERLVELRSHVVPRDRFKLPLADTVTYTSQAGVTGPVKNPATGAALTLAETQLENTTDCTYDHPQDLPVPPKVQAAIAGASVVDGRAIKAAWIAKIVKDWNQHCRVETLRAVSKVRILDQIPPDIDPATVTAAVYAKRGSWTPGWDIEVQDFKFCQGGTGGTTVCGDQ